MSSKEDLSRAASAAISLALAYERHAIVMVQLDPRPAADGSIDLLTSQMNLAMGKGVERKLALFMLKSAVHQLENECVQFEEVRHEPH
jgi:hypothetical protein